MRVLLILLLYIGSIAHAEGFNRSTYFNVVPNSTNGSWSILLFDGNRQIKSDPIPNKSKEELEDIAFEATVYSKLGLLDKVKTGGADHFRKYPEVALMNAIGQVSRDTSAGFAKEILKLKSDLRDCKMPRGAQPQQQDGRANR